MGFILSGGEADLEFVVCCEAMRRATRVLPRPDSECAPFVGYSYPPKLHGCDAEFSSEPIKYCPWCGKEIVSK